MTTAFPGLILAAQGRCSDHDGPLVVLKGGREPFRRPRRIAIDQHGHRPSAKERIGVGLVGRLSLTRPHPPDRTVLEQAVGQQKGRVGRIRPDASQVENDRLDPFRSSCAASLRSSCGVLPTISLICTYAIASESVIRKSQSPFACFCQPLIDWPRVLAANDCIVRDAAAPACRTLIVTFVPSSPRSRSIASRNDIPLVSTPSICSIRSSRLTPARSAGPPSMTSLHLGPFFLVVHSQGDVNADVAVALGLLLNLAFFLRHELRVAGNTAQQPIQQRFFELLLVTDLLVAAGQTSSSKAASCSEVVTSETRRLNPSGSSAPALCRVP